MRRMWKITFADGSAAYLESASAEGALWQTRLLIWAHSRQWIKDATVEAAKLEDLG